MTEHLWGIDVGGTKLEGVVLNPNELHEPLCRIRINTEQEKGYQHLLDRIELLVSEMKMKTGLTPKRFGMGTPGAFDPQAGVMKNGPNLKGFDGSKFPTDISKRLGAPCVTANDANCFALAESIMGAAKGGQSCFGVILGTGVGGGIVIDGKVHNGFQGIAGEWGHVCLIPDGDECGCGRRGCIEAYLRGPRLERYYENRANESRSLKEIYERFEAGGDPAAAETIDHLCTLLARALSVIINVLDPEYIVLGGGVSNLPVVYSKAIPLVAQYVFNLRLETKIVKNRLGDSAGVFGAALLVL